MIYLIITIGAITIVTTVVALTYAALSTCNMDVRLGTPKTRS